MPNLHGDHVGDTFTASEIELIKKRLSEGNSAARARQLERGKKVHKEIEDLWFMDRQLPILAISLSEHSSLPASARSNPPKPNKGEIE